jgi:hypothetical protein
LVLQPFCSGFPTLHVPVALSDLNSFDVRQNVWKLLENRHYHELNEARLPTSNLGGLSVAHHRDLKALGLLHVSLIEEFLKEQVSPSHGCFKLPHVGADVAGVQESIWDQLFAVLNGRVVCGVDQFVLVASIVDPEPVQVVLEFFSQIFHCSHVSGQNGHHDPLLHHFNALAGKSPSNEVQFSHVHQLQSLSSVVILLHVLLAVHLADRRLGHEMIPIVEPIVGDIVTQSSHQKREHVQVVKLGKGGQVLAAKNEHGVLCDVSSVEIIVVLNWAFVLVVDLAEEKQELFEVNEVLQVILPQEGCGHERHLPLATHSLLALKNIKVVGVNAIEEIAVLVH